MCVAGSAFVAYLSVLSNIAYTATQYALFGSLFPLLGKLVAGFSGAIVDALGYPLFFLYTASLTLPAIVLSLYFIRRPPTPATPVPPSAHTSRAIKIGSMSCREIVCKYV